MNLGPLTLSAPDECWEWTGCKNNRGYGSVSKNGRPELVHRVTYELVNGPIPPGRELDHLCRNRACANPRHLEPVTHRENCLRGERHKHPKTHCPQGHLYDAVHSWRITQTGKTVSSRRCSICRREQARARDARRRAA